MNYFKRKMLGYVLRCGGGEGGDGSGDGVDAGFDAAQFGTPDAPAGATGGGSVPGTGDAAPATAPAATSPAPAPSGIIGMTEAQADKALADFDAGRSTASPPAIGGSLPTAGSLVADATGSRTLGNLANLGLSATPLGPLNAALGMGNLAIGAINELSSGSQQTAMNGPALVGNNGVGAAQAIADGGFNNQTGEGGVPAAAGGSTVAAGNGEGGNVAPTGIIGSVTSPPATPATPPAPVAAPEVNYSMFGSVGMGGWSSAARRYAAKKGQVRV